MSAGVPWIPNQVNEITFVMVDSSNNELTGLTPSGFVRKAGGSFVAVAGTIGEIGFGWYFYRCTAAEADTVGPISLHFTAAGAEQQNLEYAVLQRPPGATLFRNGTAYVVEDPVGTPIQGVEVNIRITNVDTDPIIWKGVTDVFGNPLDANNNDPYLQSGTYYLWRFKPGYTFPNPDTEVHT